MIVTIIGLGLIGGSLAIDLRKRKFAKKIIGVDNNQLHANTALKIALVDEVCELDEAVNRADLVILAVPVDATVKLLPRVMDRAKNKVVTDMCSTKEQIIRSIENHPNRKQFVASHPMSGTEFSGPWAAMPDLFDGKCAVLCDAENSNKKAVDWVYEMYNVLNMRVVYMNAVAHDMHAAYVSHISHISSFALALTVLEKEKNEKHIFDLASGGFDSTVRLAKSSAEMWTPIFLQNDKNVLTVLDTYIEKLQLFKKLITESSEDDIHRLIKDSNRIKRILKKNGN